MTFTPILLGSGTTGFAFLQRTRETQEDTLRQSPEVSRDVGSLRERLTQIDSADKLLDDREVLRVVLSSFGLEEDFNNRAFLKQILESDLNDRASFANRLSDSRYSDLASSFNFAGSNGPNVPGAAAADTLAPSLQSLNSVDALFEEGNARLLSRALDVFELEQDAENVEFLKAVLRSDLDDPTSLVNRLGDARYVDFAAAFSGQQDSLSDALRQRVSEDVASQLRQVSSAQDLIGQPALLRSVLTEFGLDAAAGNSFFLERVLDSDLRDPNSFVNTLSDTRFVELAQAFDFAGRRATQGSLYAFAELAGSRPDSLSSADALLEDRDLLEASLKLFGLEGEIDNTALLRDVLNSSLSDETSVANQQEDSRFRGLASAFDFEATQNSTELGLPSRSPIDALIIAVDARNRPAASVEEFFEDPRLYLAAIDLFGLSQGADAISYTRRALASDPDVPTSPISLASDPRYSLLQKALNFEDPDQAFTYPAGFVDAIVDNYISRKFEVAVGEQDNTMRVSLSFERDLGAVIERTRSNDSRWFGVMSQPPLRAVFEAAFGLPSSFGQLDINQQLGIFKDRAERFLGTSDVGDMLLSENLETLERRYLGAQASSAGGVATANVASILLSNIQSSAGNI